MKNNGSELVFDVTQENGGFVAECMSEDIFTQGDTRGQLRENIREAVSAYYFDAPAPAMIGLHLVDQPGACRIYCAGPDVFAMQPLQVLFEDNHLLAVNKAPSDIVQGDATGDVTLADRAAEYLKQKHGKPGNVFVGIAHRLDRPVSGIVIFARTSKALERMNALFRSGDVRKRYWAVVDARPPKDADCLVHWITRNPEQNKSYAAPRPVPGAREARLSYRLLASLERYWLLEIDLETGRHHQIRAQLAAIGCHIKGDLKYGARRSNPGGGIHLHAREVSFEHPVRKVPLTIIAPPPPDPVWDAVVAAIGGT